MRRQDVIVRADGKGQSQYLGYRVKILQSSALQAGNVSIVWNPAAGAPTVHQIIVYRDGEAIDVLKLASFDVLRREDQLEQAKLDGLLTAILRVPDLRVGDELEVGVTVPVNDPTLGADASGVLLLGPAPAPGRYRLRLMWNPSTPAMQWRATPDIAPIASKSANAVDFRFDNPAIQAPPKDAPARYQWQRAVEYSSFGDWADLSRHFAPLYLNAQKLGSASPLKKEAARIAATHPTAYDRASAALRLVQQDIRYIYVGLNGGNLKPSTAEETWQRRYGDCKGKTALLLALLTELGVSAEPVLINSSGLDDGLDQRLPLPQMFDHVLVRAHIDGVDYWLDGTLPPVAPPASRPVFPIGWALPLTSAGASLQKIAWRVPTTPDEVNLYEIDAREGFDKPARITSTTIVRGVEGLKQHLQFSPIDHDQMLGAFRQQFIGDTWQSIDDVEWRYDEKIGASILKIIGSGAVNWDQDGDSRSLALPGGGFNPPEKRLRAGDQATDTPYYTKPEFSCHVTTVRLPKATQARQWSSKPSYDMSFFGRTYHRAFDIRDGSIRMIRGSRVDRPEIDGATARRDNARIAQFDNSMGWITYDPKGTKAGVGSGAVVPATYDIDWTAPDVPCLSSRPAN